MTTSKSILITGCSHGGIGSFLAEEFHRRGLRVFATVRTPVKVAHLAAIGIETFPLNVTSPNSISTTVESISTLTGGKLDFLLNNSGSGYNMPTTDIDISEAKAIFDVNFFGVIAVTKAFMPLLIRAHGMVINHTSIVAVAPLPFFGIYNSSKAAAHSITRSMRLELAPLGVRIVELLSGKVESKFFENVGSREAAPMLPESSYFRGARQEVERMLAGKTASGAELDATAGEVFAREVVGEILKSGPKAEIWRGASASIVWLLTSFFPRSIQDIVLGQISDFKSVASKIAR